MNWLKKKIIWILIGTGFLGMALASAVPEGVDVPPIPIEEKAEERNDQENRNPQSVKSPGQRVIIIQ